MAVTFQNMSLKNYTVQSLITSGLILHWDVGNPSSYTNGSSTITDLTGNGYTGTISSSPTYNSNFGGYLSAGGFTNASVGSNFFNLTPNITVSMWIRVTNAGTLNGIGGFRSNMQFYTLVFGSGANEMRVGGSSYVQPSLSSFTSYYANWIYLTMWADGVNTGQYVNTTNMGSTAIVYNFGNAASFAIGKAAAFGATMDLGSVQIYNRGLSASEITSNYNATKSRFGL